MDLMRLLYTAKDVAVAIGTTGGFWFLLDRFLRRARIKIRLEGIGTSLTFEAENTGDVATSLDRYIVLTARRPTGESVRLEYDVVEVNRQLSPHEPKRFTADFRGSFQELNYLWLCTYHFGVTRGRGVTVRRANMAGGDLGRLSMLRARWDFAHIRAPSWREVEEELKGAQRRLREAGHRVEVHHSAEGWTLLLDGSPAVTEKSLSRFAKRVRALERKAHTT